MDIKQAIRSAGVRQWQIAEAVGVSEFTLSRWLRRPERLKPEQVAKIEAAIQKVKAQKGAR
ncbi:MAG: LacI family DNA-binding transcriptional regulator [Syntrophomonadales bacterium]